MRPPHHPPIPPAAAPVRTPFDPWNSSATGHQRADSRLAGSTLWRQSRTRKLGEQFRSGAGGGKRLSDTVGAGSDRFGTDGRKADGGWERGAAVALRENSGWGDVAAMMSAAGAGKGKGKQPGKEESVLSGPDIGEDPPGLRDRPLFGGLCVYVNGSTAPAVGDLKLKHLLAQHGAHVAIALARRSVTHVILGKANGTAGGAGGGLAGGKLQKEISRVGGKGVKFVGVEWVLESVKAGRRLPEASFGMGVARPAGVGSVHEMFGKGKEKGGA